MAKQKGKKADTGQPADGVCRKFSIPGSCVLGSCGCQCLCGTCSVLFYLAADKRGVTGCTGLWCGTESVYLWLECSRFCNPVYADLYRGIDLFSFGSIPSAGKYEVKTDATYLISADWIYG